MTRIFVEIISACRSLEDTPKVVCLGPEGTFSEEAVFIKFGKSCETSLVTTIDEVFRAVEAKAAYYGVVPLENSTEGAVSRTLDLFVSTPLKMCGEVFLPVHHNLLSKTSKLSDLERVYSHSQSFGQCANWLMENLPTVDRVVVKSNAEAAKLACRELRSAAIAGLAAGKKYDLPLLEANIQDSPNNVTRFAILGHDYIGVSNNDKTSFVMSTKSKPGALTQLLQPLAENGVNMSRLESRPSRSGNWEYVFFVDVQGHLEDRDVALSLSQIRAKAGFLKILGSYPVDLT